MVAVVAIIGRPNVGKSTLFNRLVGRRAALVHPTPGVTRDRREGEANLAGLEFTVVDTAGLEEAERDTLNASVQFQTHRAMAEADVALLLIDSRAGITPLDRHFGDWARRSSTPVVLIANKCEGRSGQSGMLEAYELGLGDPVPISAEHGEGMADLRDALAPYVSDDTPEDGDDREGDENEYSGPLRLAIVGRPNVGKSTLINRLVGDERVVTGPDPGVTRDAIAVDWNWRDMKIELYDTAGMRRRARVHETLEHLSVGDSERAIRFAHVVVLMMDGEAVAERQDLTIARRVVEEGRALVLAVNKWDIVDDRRETLTTLEDRLERSLPQARGIPVVRISALTGAGVERLMPAVAKVYELWNRRLPTGPLNRWLEETIARHPPPMVQGRRMRLRYITQVKARPPTFALFASRASALPESYIRYLVNGLREDFGLQAVPIRLLPRRGRNPYAES
jgi:GTP-binding protein